MAGKFTRSRYEADDGKIYAVRVQPETITTANPAPTAALTPGLPSAKVGKGIRGYGVGTRYITAKWTGTVPDGYDANGVLRIPILTIAAYTGIALNSTFTYLGQPTVVIGKTGERVK